MDRRRGCFFYFFFPRRQWHGHAVWHGQAVPNCCPTPNKLGFFHFFEDYSLYTTALISSPLSLSLTCINWAILSFSNSSLFLSIFPCFLYFSLFLCCPVFKYFSLHLYLCFYLTISSHFPSSPFHKNLFFSISFRKNLFFSISFQS